MVNSCSKAKASLFLINKGFSSNSEKITISKMHSLLAEYIENLDDQPKSVNEIKDRPQIKEAISLVNEIKGFMKVHLGVYCDKVCQLSDEIVAKLSKEI